MGRKKIQISRIGDERNRQVTFTKRKFGLMKKAYELSVLCDCEIALIIFNSSNKLFQYASTDMDKVLLKYTEYNEPHESRTNSDIIEMLNKKDNKNCDSPDVDHQPQLPTPGTMQRYAQIDKQFDEMMTTLRPQQATDFPSHPVSFPVTDRGIPSYPTSGFGLHPHGLHPEHDPNLLHPHRRSSPLPRSPLAGGGHSPSRSPSGPMYSPEMSMVSDASSPGGNGYSGPSQQRGSSPSMHIQQDRTSPMPRKQIINPPSPNRSHLHVVIPQSHNPQMDGVNELSTPVVSLATPSVMPYVQQGYSAVGDYPILTGSDLPGFSPSPGSILHQWPQHQLGTPQIQSSLAHHGVPMVTIKSEPASPPDKMADQASMNRSVEGRSPMEVVASYDMDERNSMLLENGDRLPTKRQRVEAGPSTSPGWTT
ncbi:myocyte-specific enhancer factor 2C-like isoform X2 [Clavelina lepadiformis]|uniref:myocyte-specific enhancer factor 2C-like isoform X2 n=1 Tax=Clavelina lepadiformis TaxID=159417 RepID=UPI0040430D51